MVQSKIKRSAPTPIDHIASLTKPKFPLSLSNHLFETLCVSHCLAARASCRLELAACRLLATGCPCCLCCVYAHTPTIYADVMSSTIFKLSFNFMPLFLLVQLEILVCYFVNVCNHFVADMRIAVPNSVYYHCFCCCCCSNGICVTN